MNSPIDNETWLIERGDEVIKKRAPQGLDDLSPLERIIYCFWVADYGMRNAGDLESASDLYEQFHSEAFMLASELSLPLTLELFRLSTKAFEASYFMMFDGVCRELQQEATPLRSVPHL